MEIAEKVAPQSTTALGANIIKQTDRYGLEFGGADKRIGEYKFVPDKNSIHRHDRNDTVFGHGQNHTGEDTPDGGSVDCRCFHYSIGNEFVKGYEEINGKRQVKTDLWEDKSPTGIEQVCIPVDLKQRNQSDMDRYGNAQQEKGEQPFVCSKTHFPIAKAAVEAKG